MNFKITNDKDDFELIKVEIEFEIDTWEELARIMEILDEVGV